MTTDTRMFPVGKPAHEVEDVVSEWYGGVNHIIAVEVFDADTSRQDRVLDTVIGPWVVGPPDAVYAVLEANGWEDYATQYEMGREAWITEGPTT